MSNKHVTINPDWLEFMLEGQLKPHNIDGDYIELPDGFVLKELNGGTKHFTRRFEVYFEGLSFGNLRIIPRNDEILNPNWQQFKIDNERLYEVGYIDHCRRFFSAIGSQVRNVTRLDIAADGFGYMHLMKRFHAGMIEKVGRAKYTLHCGHSRQIEGFDIGSKASDKSLTGYRKADRIKADNKHYITEFWKKSGLQNWDSPNVERLEIRLKNAAMLRIESFDWQQLESSSYLAGIMKKQMHKFFEFRKSGSSNITRAKQIQFIDWDNVKADRLKFAEARRGDEVNRLKQTSKSLYWLYLGTRQQYYLQLVNEIVTNINCVIWFQEKSTLWRTEFDKKNNETQIKGLKKKREFAYIPLWKQLQSNEQLRLSENYDLSFQYIRRRDKRA